jgi:outer membrane autotransporter protein
MLLTGFVFLYASSVYAAADTTVTINAANCDGGTPDGIWAYTGAGAGDNTVVTMTTNGAGNDELVILATNTSVTTITANHAATGNADLATINVAGGAAAGLTINVGVTTAGSLVGNDSAAGMGIYLSAATTPITTVNIVGNAVGAASVTAGANDAAQGIAVAATVTKALTVNVTSAANSATLSGGGDDSSAVNDEAIYVADAATNPVVTLNVTSGATAATVTGAVILGRGNDVVTATVGGAGNISMAGIYNLGAGDDTITLTNSGAGTIGFGTTSATLLGTGNNTLTASVTAGGTAGNTTIGLVTGDAGNDTITLTTSAAPAAGATITIGVMDLAAGTNALNITTGNTAIVAGTYTGAAGADTITMTGGVGNVTIGNIALGDTVANTVTGTFSSTGALTFGNITGGTAADTISLTGKIAAAGANSVINLAAGGGSVTINGTTDIDAAGTLTITGGAAADTISVTNASTSAWTLQDMVLGGGTDSVTLVTSSTGNLTAGAVTGNTGNDTVVITSGTGTTLTTGIVGLSTGTNAFTVSGAGIVTLTSVTTGATGDNTLTFNTTTALTTLTTGTFNGGANHTVAIGAGSNLKLDDGANGGLVFGTGNDSVTITNTTACTLNDGNTALDINLGTGTNSLVINGAGAANALAIGVVTTGATGTNTLTFNNGTGAVTLLAPVLNGGANHTVTFIGGSKVDATGGTWTFGAGNDTLVFDWSTVTTAIDLASETFALATGTNTVQYLGAVSWTTNAPTITGVTNADIGSATAGATGVLPAFAGTAAVDDVNVTSTAAIVNVTLPSFDMLAGNDTLDVNVGNFASTVTVTADVDGIDLGADADTVTLTNTATTGTTTVLTLANTTANATGVITGGAGADTLTFTGTGAGTTQLVATKIIGIETLTKTGTAAWEWAADAARTSTTNLDDDGVAGGVDGSFTTLTVTAGSLRLNGVLGSRTGTVLTAGNAATIAAGATLCGNFTWYGGLTQSGTLAPGNSVGTDTIAGNYVVNAGATLAIEIEATPDDAANAADQVIVGGNTTIGVGGAATVAVDMDSERSTYTSGTYTIIDTAGTLTRTTDFLLTVTDETDNINNNAVAAKTLSSAVLGFALNYTTQDVQLVVTRTGYAAFGNSKNTKAVGNYLNAFNKTTIDGSDMRTVLNALDDLDTGAEVRDALEEMHAEPYADYANITLKQLTQNRTQVGTRLGELRRQGGLASSEMPSIAPMGPAAPAAAANGMSVWAQGYGNWANQDSEDDHFGYDYDTYGVMLGLDKKYDKFVFGINTGFAWTDMDWDNVDAEGSIDTWHIGLYGSYATQQYFIDAGMSYGRNWYDTDRKIDFGTISRTAKADSVDGDEFSMFVGAGYNVKFGDGFVFVPTLSLQYSYVGVDNFSEGGANALNLNVNDFEIDAFESSLGFRLGRVFTAGTAKVLPEFRAAWVHNFCDDNADITASMQGATGSFKTESADIQDDYFVLGAGLTAYFQENISAYVNYDLNLADNYDAHNLTLGIRFDF